ncbi:MAG: 2-polyprenyl-3-methyl-5-hydroxy-6-metoxy-1,4-benzoquinol methylase [Myxococcota bacterium]|jgi:2-polyprenyl-3-methyl-5-hydroxy-6-metoxy-1,4-benzoquinol methylase
MTAETVFWDDLADRYSKKPVDNPDAFEQKIATTKSRMSSSDVVLDIGCGTGSLALRLAGSGAHIHGLDFSPEMIRIANEKSATVDNVTFHVGKFDESFRAIEPGSLDGICAYSLLHLVEDTSPVLAQIFKLLKPGGFFISSTACLGDTWIPYGVVLPFMKWIGKAPLVRVFKREGLEGDVRAAGFVDLNWPEVGAAKTTAFLTASKPG